MNRKNAIGAAIVQTHGNIKISLKDVEMAVEPGHWSVKVTMQRVSGITADAVTNTFHFLAPVDGLLMSTSGLHDRVVQFYNTPPTGQTVAIAGFLAPALARTPLAHTTTIQNHGDFSAPITTPWTLGAGVTPYTTFTGPPAEVAICASFKNNTFVGVPIQRRRGRVYVGPLAGVGFGGTNSEVILNPALPPIVNAAMKDLKLSTSQTSSSGFQWVIWSPTDSLGRGVESGWTDTSPDIQRRRGIKPGGKVTWS